MNVEKYKFSVDFAIVDMKILRNLGHAPIILRISFQSNDYDFS